MAEGRTEKQVCSNLVMAGRCAHAAQAPGATDPKPSAADTNLRMGLKESHLARQSPRVRDIIGVHSGNVLSTRQFYTVIQDVDQAPIRTANNA
jgi:hypothetical protein